MARKFGNASLCWCCKKAVANLRRACCWANFYIPVDGWELDAVAQKRGRTNVVTCPQFEPDDCVADAVGYCKAIYTNEDAYYKAFANQLEALDYNPMRKKTVDFITDKCQAINFDLCKSNDNTAHIGAITS